MAAAQIVARIKGYLVGLGVMTNGQLLVGQTGGKPVPRTISGDLTIDADGVAVVTGAEATRLAMGAAVLKTVASGAFAMTAGVAHYKVAGAGGLADDLDSITGGAEGDVLFLRPSDDAVDITIKHAEGANLIACAGATDIILAETDDYAELVHNGTQWTATARKLKAADVGTTRIVAGALAASVGGRALMADDFFDEATATAKFADQAIATALIKDLNVTEGKLAAGAVTAAKLADAVADALWTVVCTPAAAVGDVITVSVQVKDVQGNNVAAATQLVFKPVTAVDASYSPADGGAGTAFSISGDKVAAILTDATGLAEIAVTDTAAETIGIAFETPLGPVVCPLTYA